MTAMRFRWPERIDLEAQIKEVRRELALRERVYGGQIARGKMRPEDAQRLGATMQAVLDSLRRLQAIDAAPMPAEPAPEQVHPDATVLIWHGARSAFWRPDGDGHTDYREEAGRWRLSEAARISGHLPPSEGIQFLDAHRRERKVTL